MNSDGNNWMNGLSGKVITTGSPLTSSSGALNMLKA